MKTSVCWCKEEKRKKSFVPSLTNGSECYCMCYPYHILLGYMKYGDQSKYYSWVHYGEIFFSYTWVTILYEQYHKINSYSPQWQNVLTIQVHFVWHFHSMVLYQLHCLAGHQNWISVRLYKLPGAVCLIVQLWEVGYGCPQNKMGGLKLSK